MLRGEKSEKNTFISGGLPFKGASPEKLLKPQSQKVGWSAAIRVPFCVNQQANFLC